MDDPVLVAIRFALYADLMLIIGLAAFPLYAMTRDERARPELTAVPRRTVQWLYAAGLLISTLGMGVLAASMQGVGLFALDVRSFWDIVRQSDVGTAWLYRSAALAVGLAVSIRMARRPSAAAVLLVVAGMVATATLAWSGHAAATEGMAGTIHRISDMTHMAAAAVWIGAIAAFLLLLRPKRAGRSSETMAIAARSLERFSTVGTLCVCIVAATGLINGQMVVGAENLGRSLASPYGKLLLVKLALFALMLVLAAANRWRLAPALGATSRHADAGSSDALAAMRRSLIVEAAAAFAILALVAWFGMLDPFGGESP